MNTYYIYIRRVSEHLIQFFVVMNGRLLDVQEWKTRTINDKSKARAAIHQYGGFNLTIPWSDINKTLWRGDWEFKLHPEDVHKAYIDWPKQDDDFFIHAPVFQRKPDQI